MPFNTLIFDLDGPLLEGQFKHYQCYYDILIDNHFKPVSIDQYWEMKRNRIDRHQLLKLSDASDFYDTYLSEWLKRIESQSYLSLDRLQKNVLKILKVYKASKKRLILATARNRKANLEWQLKQLRLRPLFDEVIAIGSQENKSKALFVLPYLQSCAPQQCLWIGDTEVDIESAKELGVKSVALTCGLRTQAYLESLKPDYLEKNLYHFAQWAKENIDL